MRLRPVGRSALLIECRDGDEVSAWRAELWRRREAGELRFVEIVPGATTILLDGVDSATAALLTEWPAPPAVLATDGPLVKIRTTFDGDDLAEVAARLRARLRVYARAAGGVGGAPTRRSATSRSGRCGRPRRVLCGYLPGCLAGRLAVGRTNQSKAF
jgi:hypothetical protein